MPPQVNGQPQPYSPGPPTHPHYQPPQASQQPVYTQSTLIPVKPNQYQQPPHSVQVQSYQQHPQPHHLEQGPASQHMHGDVSQHASPQPQIVEPHSAVAQPAENTGPAKKRQRVTKPATESPLPEPIPPQVDSPFDPAARKTDDVDELPVPEPTAEEIEKINRFNKRTKAAQQKFPPIKGLPHLIYESTIKLPGIKHGAKCVLTKLLTGAPAPKSYDKLAPLIALPPRSQKPMVPELGYSLPCEIQGNFTVHYRPAPDNFGLDERRTEGKDLLDSFEHSMKSLGKKRPKYTEYPHSFKEQLKSDEASRNKAEKKARKEQEDERNKPIRPLTRPDDEVEAAIWDMIGIVHVEPTVNQTSSLVATRVQQAGDLFIKLRSDMTKAKLEHDKAIEEIGRAHV